MANQVLSLNKGVIQARNPRRIGARDASWGVTKDAVRGGEFTTLVVLVSRSGNSG